MKAKNFFVLILMGSFILNGCTSTVAKTPTAPVKVTSTALRRGTAIPDLITGFLSDQSCGAPCWQGLIPGKSTGGDMDRYLENLDPQEWPVKRSKATLTGCTKKQINDRPGEVTTASTEFSIKNGFLTFIEVFPGRPLLLQSVVERYGSPEYFSPIVTNFGGPDVYMLNLYYPRQGLALEMAYYTAPEMIGAIRPDMYVGTLYLFQPGDMLSFFIARDSCEGELKQITLEANQWISKYVRPWTGYGKMTTIREE
jgi:hypothetical protein